MSEAGRGKEVFILSIGWFNGNERGEGESVVVPALHAQYDGLALDASYLG